jgi:hypothetical protein
MMAESAEWCAMMNSLFTFIICIDLGLVYSEAVWKREARMLHLRKWACDGVVWSLRLPTL